MCKPDEAPWLHVRGQFTYHGEARIAGTVEGLTALRDAISLALEGGEGHASVFATDGEGYRVEVVRCRTLGAMGSPPYIDELGREASDFERRWLVEQERPRRCAFEEGE